MDPDDESMSSVQCKPGLQGLRKMLPEKLRTAALSDVRVHV